MTTNKDWLNSLKSDELKVWLNADHDTHTVTSKVDTRAQLEADISDWLGSWTAFSVPISKVKQFIFDCLDMQDAITKSHCDLAGVRAKDILAENLVLRVKLKECERERVFWRKLCSDIADRVDDAQFQLDAYGLTDEGLA